MPQTSPPNLVATNPNISILNASSSNPLPPGKSYHIPNSPTTILITDYASPPTTRLSDTYLTLLKASNSISRSLVTFQGDGLLYADQVTWSWGGVQMTVYNRGYGGDGKLMWSTLSNAVLGIGVVLDDLKCTSAQWTIRDAEEGDIGIGVIGEKGVGGEALLLLNRTLTLGVDLSAA